MKTELLRRKERAMKSSRDMELLLEQALVGRLAVTTDEGPYLVAVNYLYHEGHIYFHSSLVGRKVEALRADPRVCFMVDEVGPQVLWEQGCGISQVYRSVVCFGTAGFVEDQADKTAILERMVKKYVPAGYAPASMSEANIERTAIVRIAVAAMSGKENPLSPLHTVIVHDPAAQH